MQPTTFPNAYLVKRFFWKDYFPKAYLVKRILSGYKRMMCLVFGSFGSFGVRKRSQNVWIGVLVSHPKASESTYMVRGLMHSLTSAEKMASRICTVVIVHPRCGPL